MNRDTHEKTRVLTNVESAVHEEVEGVRPREGADDPALFAQDDLTGTVDGDLPRPRHRLRRSVIDFDLRSKDLDRLDHRAARDS
jgi:hypothetical protein